MEPDGLAPAERALHDTCRALVRMRSEAAATSLATHAIRRYERLDHDGRIRFFGVLLREFPADETRLRQRIAEYLADPGDATAQRVAEAATSPRQTLVELVNAAQHGTATVVRWRADLLALLDEHPELAPVEHDLHHLLRLWFNRGLLRLERIGWRSPAELLEKLIEYEAVHEITSWDDLRRRLAADRRCFGFFHPSLPGEPLIFVQVALTRGLASSIQHLLEAPQPDDGDHLDADTATFYSISNCQQGLLGISFGDFLLKQVTEALAVDLPQLRRFATLSPIPGLVEWLRSEGEHDPVAAKVVDEVDAGAPPPDDLRGGLLGLTARYLLRAKRGLEPLDPVARFHLRNGARVERLCWLGDVSPKGLATSAGVLVNYEYDQDALAANHEAYVNDGTIATSEPIDELATG